jgi:hypothetical protein
VRTRHVVVVVKDLVVVAAPAIVAVHEDGVRPVDHDLPHVGIVEQGLERAVAGQIAQRPLGGDLRLGDVEGPPAPLVLPVPGIHLVVDEFAQAGAGIAGGHVEGHVLGPLLHGPLDLDEG